MNHKIGSVLRAGLCVLILMLEACGEDSPTATRATSTARGTLIYDPPLRIASLDAAAFTAQLQSTISGQQLLALAGKLSCGVDFYYLRYWTVDPSGNPVTASGALILPTGATAPCVGPRPIVLYAHATQPNKNFNIADVTDPANTEGALIAAIFAAQGYMVVASNYSGYDQSSLTFHPYLNADQQSKDMIDSLTAARSALPLGFLPTTIDDGKLFVTGYSEGGHVAMATVKALQAAGIPVVASAPMSGPYALEAFGDAIFYGNVDLGSTVIMPLVTSSYQGTYGDIYTATTDIYETGYANGIGNLLPSTTPIEALFQEGKLPVSALFNSTTPVVPGSPVLTGALQVPMNPLFAAGFGPSNLVTNNYRVNYVLDAAMNPDGAVGSPQADVPLAAHPQQPLRIAFNLNDMRNGNWLPMTPMLLCGGDQDPDVFFDVNTGTMQAHWSGLPAGLVTVLDVNATPTPGDPFAPLQLGFQQTEEQIVQSSGQQAAVESYHTTVAPFCAVAARGFFSKF